MKKIILLLIAIFYLALGNLALADASASLQNPLGAQDLTAQQAAGRIIGTVLGIVGSLALIMFIIGGFQWMTSGGNQERVKKGRDTLMWSTLGLVVIFAAYAILKFVFEALI
jgi:hypothetical protein